MTLEKREDAVPGVLGVRCELLVLAVEEAVGSSRVDHDLVLDARGGERLVEGLRVLDGDACVVAGLEREDRAGQLGRALRRPRRAVVARSRPPWQGLQPKRLTGCGDSLPTMRSGRECERNTTFCFASSKPGRSAATWQVWHRSTRGIFMKLTSVK